jgi:hypothetical protein
LGDGSFAVAGRVIGCPFMSVRAIGVVQSSDCTTYALPFWSHGPNASQVWPCVQSLSRSHAAERFTQLPATHLWTSPGPPTQSASTVQAMPVVQPFDLVHCVGFTSPPIVSVTTTLPSAKLPFATSW